MPRRGEKLIIGQRLKVLRKSLGLTQAQMAEQLGVSASYITLIESDQRPASAKLLMRLAQVFDLNIAELAPTNDPQLSSDFEAALKDPALEAEAITRAEREAVLNAAPGVAAALVRLQGKYTEALMQGGPAGPGEGLEIWGQIGQPVEKVRDWLYRTRNYIDAIDRAAEAQAGEMALHRSEPHVALSERLRGHGIRARILPDPVMGGALRRFDPHRRELMFSELLTQPSRRFQIAVMLGRLEHGDLIEHTVRQAGFDNDEARSLARVSLFNYFAAALLMPYRRFIAACEAERYDVDLIGHRFGVSYEQAAHRMTTLQRPDARGIPFFFVRVDRAGNVSKRFSAGRFPFSRFGGTCPLWNIHSAFETPDRVHCQLVQMPEGGRYFSIARTVARAGGSHSQPAPKFVIGLGCDVSYAPRLVYADAINMERAEPTDIGLNCFLCERSNCASRAAAPINRKLAVNERERSMAIYRFEGE